MKNNEDYIIIDGYKHKLYKSVKFSEVEMLKRSEEFYKWLDKRRTVREYSSNPVSREIIENILMSASTAPSGANHQPWTFCAISNPQLKSEIRQAAEMEEKKSYEQRMGKEWKKDLEHLATNIQKPFLEEAPWLIAVFKKPYDLDENSNRINNYYVNESVGLACGILIAAIHNAGLSTLTYTPSPMAFLSKILDRPVNEKPFLLLPVGYPKEPLYVPDISRKNLDNISVFYE